MVSKQLISEITLASGRLNPRNNNPLSDVRGCDRRADSGWLSLVKNHILSKMSVPTTWVSCGAGA